MGFLKNFVGELAGKGGIYEASTAFTVNGIPNDIRAFVKQCTSEPCNGQKNDKERWLWYDAVKKGTIKNDTANQMMFVYQIEWVINKMPCSFYIQGNFAGNNQTQINIKYRQYCYSNNDVQKELDIIKEAITDKYPQQ